jgi:bifunctional non-homologous end joining protein LigD
VPKPFSRQSWIFELKYDGFRAMASKRAGKVALTSRRGTNLLPNYPEIRKALEQLPDLAIDAELVVLDAEGRPDFDQLSRRLRVKRPIEIAAASAKYPAALLAFDLLELAGKDLRELPLLKRKAALRRVLRGNKRIRPVTYVRGAGEALFREVEKLGLEGMVAKPADGPYLRGTACGWLKVKTDAGRAVDEQRREWNK